MKNDKMEYLTNLILNIMSDDNYRPMRFKELGYVFDLHSKSQKSLLSNSLNYLIKEKKIEYRNSRYYLRGSNVFVGIYEQGKGRYGFVSCEDLEEDIFVLGSNSMDAFNGDKVRVEIIEAAGNGRKASGVITEIVEKVKRQTVGTFCKNHNFGFVISDDPKFTHDIYISKRNMKGVKNGEKVVVEITAFPADKNWEGKITEIIGGKDSVKRDIDILIRQYDIPDKFDRSVILEADSLKYDSFDEFKDMRKDITDRVIFTIDGAAAKDLDDAVSIKKKGEEYILSVHIADVSNYVKPGSEIDKAAYERGTSVYFPDRVVPMLPKALCENLCSLNPNENKKAFSVDMTINKYGKLMDYNFYKSVIRSRAKFVYDEVNMLFDGSKDLRQEYYDYEEDLLLMRELYEKLADRRKKEGNLDFDVDESQVIIDGNNEVKAVQIRKRGTAERIIEQFMLVANTSACEFFSNLEINGIYRVHEKPDAEKIQEFVNLVNLMGYNLKLHSTKTSKELQEFLNGIGKDNPNEQLIKTVLLRCMQKAVYTSNNKGHYALAIDNYTHFTSPIRRYPDLMVHRILSNILLGNIYTNDFAESAEQLESDARHLSKRERISEDIEREADKICICRYMRGMEGKRLEGRVTGFSNRGMFVRIIGGIEGMVPFDLMMDDYYIYNKEAYTIEGENNGKKYKIGDTVKIKVFSIDKYRREINFLMD